METVDPVTPTDKRLAPAPAAPSFDEDSTAAVVAKSPTPTQHAGDSYEIEAGVMLGEYQIEGKIGEGGMGTVWSAIHPVIGKRVAIKILKRELCQDAVTVERFIDEARVVNQIQHPNIVDIFAFGEMPDGRRYLVMELLKGETLRARIERAPPTVEEAIAIIRALAHALAAAHAKGVIHRDIKPDNVFLVGKFGNPSDVKLLDFGLAKLAREEQMTLTATGELVGTPQYISPEQAKGLSIDVRADIYSLGGVAFELLASRPPFLATSAMEVVAKHLMEAPSRPSQFSRVVPGALDDVVLAMLAKDPSGRPSLSELCRVLDAPDAPVRHPRVRWPFVALAVAALATATLLVVGRRDTLPADAARPSAPPPTAAAAPAPPPTPVVTPTPPAPPPPRQAAPPRATIAKPKPVARKPATPAAPAAPAPGVVTDGKLQVVLRGARGVITIDGRSFGMQSELAVSLPAGAHRVSVKFPNEVERTVTVHVVAGEVARREVTALYDGAPKGDELLNPNSLGGKR
jgi:eukaryotic-like serine/threonine-protein kinase